MTALILVHFRPGTSLQTHTLWVRQGCILPGDVAVFVWWGAILACRAMMSIILLPAVNPQDLTPGL
jgi:hypothetical protein